MTYNNSRKYLNLFTSVGFQIVLMIFGFLVPRIVVTSYGSDANGVLNTVAQVFTYMTLLEAGIGKSTRNALYKALKFNDKNDISSIVSSAKVFYKRTSIIYLSLVVLVSIIFPFIIKSNLNYWTIFLIILFEGLSNVISFYFFSCWDSLLITDGKSYVINSISFVSKLLCYIVKIALSLLEINIIFIQIGYFLISLLKVLFYKIYLSKKYNWVDWKSKTKFHFEDNKSYLIAEISWTVFNSTDIIVLSCFISSSIASVYSIYNMVYLALFSLVSLGFNSILYLLGDSYYENIKEFEKKYDFFIGFFVGLVSLLMCVTYWLILPFIKLYTSDITDVNYIYTMLPLFFCIIQLISWSRTTAESAIGITGNIKKISMFFVVETSLNIVLSCIFVNLWGIVGVLVATIISMPIKAIASNYFMDKKILHRSHLFTLKLLIPNYLIFVLTVILANFYDIKIESIVDFILWGFCLTLAYLIVYVIVNFFVNHSIRDYFLRIIKHKNT